MRKNEEQRTENRELFFWRDTARAVPLFLGLHQRLIPFNAILCYNNSRENKEQSNLEQSMSVALLLNTAFVRCLWFVLSIGSFCNNVSPTYPRFNDSRY